MKIESASTIFITMPYKWVSDQKFLNNPIGPMKIVHICSEFYEVPIKDMEGKCRKHQMVIARQMAMYMLKHYTNLPLVKIADLFGGRDHTTAIHSIRTVNDLCDTDPAVFTDRQIIHKQIKKHLL